MKNKKRGELIRLKKGYAMRVSVDGIRLRKSGFRTQKEARTWAYSQ